MCINHVDSGLDWDLSIIVKGVNNINKQFCWETFKLLGSTLTSTHFGYTTCLLLHLH